MSNLLINEPPLQVLPTLAKEIGLNEAIVLQQIHYWLGNRKTGKTHDGRRWVRNTVDQWQEDNFPFWSTDTIRRTIKKLEDAGYISSDNLNRSAYDRTLWYTINYNTISAMSVNPFTQNAQMDSSNEHKPIPETTEEITRETNDVIEFYYNNIGGLTPMIADSIRDAMDEHGDNVVLDAMKEAVNNNVRRWNYVNAILVNWQQNGRIKPGGAKPQKQQKATVATDSAGGFYV